MTTRRSKAKAVSGAAEKVRSPQNLDVHVGKRIRMRRALLGISQEKLAEAIGITFQQVQKYERGVNRVSASRLFQIGEVLDVPVAYFYAEYHGPKSAFAAGGLADNDQEPFFENSDELLYSKETAELLRTYYSIEDENKRRELLKIIRSMVETLS